MGIDVHSSRASGYDAWEQDLLAVADTEPGYIVDDGAELTIRMAKHRPELFKRLRGVSEQTTKGVARLRSLATAGQLPFPAMATSDAACKHMFDNRYGTGQSTIQAVTRLTNFMMAGKRVAVVGYGWVGRGIANYVRALGGRVAVVEVDPVKALEAFMDGHDVGSASTSLDDADLVITATGGVRAIHSEHFDSLKPNAVLANAGHHDQEIDMAALEDESSAREDLRYGVTRYTWRDKAINVLSSGALVNIAGGLGHPIEIMDLSFAVQGLSLHELVADGYRPGVHVLPTHVDAAIARARLYAEGVSLSVLGDDQHNTVGQWMGGAG
jgi:adenosylhomocysteinase